MRYVKTPDETRSIQAVYARGHSIGARSLRVVFETTPEAVAQLLPPPLEPTPEALGMAVLRDTANSTTVGPFRSTALYLRAGYADASGLYCVSMSVSTPEAVTFGREIYGEPRKQAKIIFERQGENVWGSAERHGFRFFSLRGRLDEAAPTGRRVESFFSFKFSPRADDGGFESPPRLIEINEEINVSVSEQGRGEIVFRDSPHDPVADIPVSQVGGATLTEGDLYTTARVLTEVDPDAFLPYAFAGIDSIESVAEGTLLNAQAARKTSQGRGRYRQSTTSI